MTWDNIKPPSRRTEDDPNGLSPNAPGEKLDAGKIMAGVLGDFSLALTFVAEVGTFGAEKYTRGGWQQVPNGVERYTDALWRHLLGENQEPFDPESGMMHAAHLAWNALARLELMLREKAEHGGRMWTGFDPGDQRGDRSEIYTSGEMENVSDGVASPVAQCKSYRVILHCKECNSPMLDTNWCSNVNCINSRI